MAEDPEYAKLAHLCNPFIWPINHKSSSFVRLYRNSTSRVKSPHTGQIQYDRVLRAHALADVRFFFFRERMIVWRIGA